MDVGCSQLAGQALGLIRLLPAIQVLRGGWGVERGGEGEQRSWEAGPEGTCVKWIRRLG